jgi:diguanylate cyclase (GGDEF)-like protein
VIAVSFHLLRSNMQVGLICNHEDWEAMVGQSIFEAPPFNKWDISSLSQELRQSGTVTIEREYQNVQNKKLHLTIKFHALHGADGGFIGLIIVIDDLTEQKLMQSRLQDLNVELAHMSATDALTSLYNRRYLFTRLEELIRVTQTQKTSLGVLMLDIDHFKLLNDNFGHQYGDFVLKHYSKIVADHMKERDIAARYGGEEFCCVIVGKTHAELRGVAENIRMAVEGYDFSDDSGVRSDVRCSIGTAMQEDGGFEDPDSFIKAADDCLYFAKENGRNCVVDWKPGLSAPETQTGQTREESRD